MAKLTMKAARVLADIRLMDAAKALNVSRTTMMHWEKGDSYPNALQFSRMCSLYGVSMDDIFLPV